MELTKLGKANSFSRGHAGWGEGGVKKPRGQRAVGAAVFDKSIRKGTSSDWGQWGGEAMECSQELPK